MSKADWDAGKPYNCTVTHNGTETTVTLKNPKSGGMYGYIHSMCSQLNIFQFVFFLNLQMLDYFAVNAFSANKKVKEQTKVKEMMNFYWRSSQLNGRCVCCPVSAT